MKTRLHKSFFFRRSSIIINIYFIKNGLFKIIEKNWFFIYWTGLNLRSSYKQKLERRLFHRNLTYDAFKLY